MCANLHQQRVETRFDLRRSCDQNERQWLKFLKYNDIEQKLESRLVDKKLAATTVSSRSKRTDKQGENSTTSSLVCKAYFTAAEGG